MADGDGAAASGKLAEHFTGGGEKGLPRRGKVSAFPLPAVFGSRLGDGEGLGAGYESS